MGITCSSGCEISHVGTYGGSIGYHSNGRLFSGDESGEDFGEEFGAGNIVGCGISFEKETIFFTKDGRMLGETRRGIKNVSTI